MLFAGTLHRKKIILPASLRSKKHLQARVPFAGRPLHAFSCKRTPRIGGASICQPRNAKFAPSNLAQKHLCARSVCTHASSQRQQPVRALIMPLSLPRCWHLGYVTPKARGGKTGNCVQYFAGLHLPASRLKHQGRNVTIGWAWFWAVLSGVWLQGIVHNHSKQHVARKNCQTPHFRRSMQANWLTNILVFWQPVSGQTSEPPFCFLTPAVCSIWPTVEYAFAALASVRPNSTGSSTKA